MKCPTCGNEMQKYGRWHDVETASTFQRHKCDKCKTVVEAPLNKEQGDDEGRVVLIKLGKH